MEKLVNLTTPSAQLRGSLVLVGLLLGLIVITAVIFERPLRSAELAARQAAERAWISAVLRPLEIEFVAERLSDLAIADNANSGAMVSIYRSGDEADSARALKFIASGGYNGDIELAVGIDRRGTIIGIAVLRHSETPGFGAVISDPTHPWLKAFIGRSLNAPDRLDWHLSSNGGAIDGISGATITSNAIIDGVARALNYVEADQQ